MWQLVCFPPKRRLFSILIVLAASGRAVAGDAPSPATTSVEQDKLLRGEHLRGTLRDMLEDAYGNDGIWPNALPPGNEGAGALVYVRPDSNVAAATKGSGGRSAALSSVTVALHERLENNPSGIWVGYTDGHLEFAGSKSDLAACEGQAAIIRPTRPFATVQPTATGRLTLKILDPSGKPVIGAMVGVFGQLGITKSKGPKLCFADGEPQFTDQHGELSLAASKLFDAKFTDEHSVPLFILDEARQFVGKIDVQRADVEQNKRCEIPLFPACKVTGRYTSIGSGTAGRKVAWTNTILFKPGELSLYTLNCLSTTSDFELLLPPGDFGISAYGTHCDGVIRYLHIEPGQREVHLEIDLPPDTVSQLINRPAPELPAMKGWLNGPPVKLSDLHGKFVLIDFWGCWCGPCVGAMPELMKLHDELSKDGLVILAIHDDSLDSIETLKLKMEGLRNEPRTGWNGRNLPFLVALDAGGPARIKYSSATTSGKATAAYGIMSFPTTLAVGRDGTVVGEVDARSEEGRSSIRKMVKGEVPPLR